MVYFYTLLLFIAIASSSFAATLPRPFRSSTSPLSSKARNQCLPIPKALKNVCHYRPLSSRSNNNNSPLGISIACKASSNDRHPFESDTPAKVSLSSMDAEDGLPLQSLVIHRMGKFILESYRGYVEENKMPNIYAKFMSTSNESGVFEMMGYLEKTHSMIVIDDVTRKMHPLSEAFQVSKNVPKIDFSSTRFETRVFSAGSYPHLQTFRNSMLFRRPGDFANMLEIVAKKAKILHLYTPLDKPIFVASLDANRPYTTIAAAMFATELMRLRSQSKHKYETENNRVFFYNYRTTLDPASPDATTFQYPSVVVLDQYRKNHPDEPLFPDYAMDYIVLKQPKYTDLSRREFVQGWIQKVRKDINYTSRRFSLVLLAGTFLAFLLSADAVMGIFELMVLFWKQEKDLAKTFDKWVLDKKIVWHEAAKGMKLMGVISDPGQVEQLLGVQFSCEDGVQFGDVVELDENGEIIIDGQVGEDLMKAEELEGKQEDEDNDDNDGGYGGIFKNRPLDLD